MILLYSKISTELLEHQCGKNSEDYCLMSLQIIFSWRFEWLLHKIFSKLLWVLWYYYLSSLNIWFMPLAHSVVSETVSHVVIWNILRSIFTAQAYESHVRSKSYWGQWNLLPGSEYKVLAFWPNSILPARER